MDASPALPNGTGPAHATSADVSLPTGNSVVSSAASSKGQHVWQFSDMLQGETALGPRDVYGLGVYPLLEYLWWHDLIILALQCWVELLVPRCCKTSQRCTGGSSGSKTRHLAWQHRRSLSDMTTAQKKFLSLKSHVSKC